MDGDLESDLVIRDYILRIVGCITSIVIEEREMEMEMD